MNLNKEIWDWVKLGEVFQIERGGSPRPIDDYFTDQPDGLNWIKIGDATETTKYIYATKQKIRPEGARKSRMVYPGDFILSNSMSFGRPYIMQTTGCIHDGWLLLRDLTNRINKDYLYYTLGSELVNRQFISFAAGTTVKNLNIEVVRKVEIPLPPPEEQEKIATLFQSIDTAVEQFDYQEESLLTLQKVLINGLLESNPQFGNTLNESNTVSKKFGEVANCIEQHDKEKKEVTRFIGLDNIEPGNFDIENWGKISDGTTFTKRFNRGDVLFGKRRSYLKKVAVADFDGICSGDILVFRANEEAILPGLLPYYVASEAFIQHAVTTSAGSLSPRTKWKDLKEFEFSIPDLKIQEMVLKVLNQIQMLLKQVKDQEVTLKTLNQNLLNEILG